MLRDFLSLYLLKPRPELWKQTRSEAGRDGEVKLVWEARDQLTVKLTGYAKQVQHVDPVRKVIVKTEFFDTNGKRIRVQEASDFRQVKGMWLPVAFKTTDYSEKVTAEIRLYRLKIDEKIEENIFSVRYLKSL
jgi:outer membrane lipoprotein-sorting protein